MSFDLYFYKRKDSTITEQDIAEYLSQNLPFNNSEHTKQWCYENPETGVYFLIHWNEINNDPEYIKSFDSFEEFKYLNFSFSINFYRPTFFGIEIFPVIEKFINSLELHVLDPQDENDPNNPHKFPSGYFQEQWTRHNNGVTLDSFEKFKFEYLPLEISNYLWLYQYHRQDLQTILGDNIFVTGFFVLKNKEDGKLYTACVWPQHIPIILPQVDYLIVQKKYSKLFKKFEASGVIPYKSIINEFKNYFETFEYIVPNLKLLKPANANKIEKQFNALKLGKAVPDFGTIIPLDRFVNVSSN